MQDLQTLVDHADHGELLIAVDGLAASRQWDALVDLARRCRDAVEMGRQLWGVATHIDYRLAWEAPAAYAAAVLRPGAGRFALGPLTEVAASTHDWQALAPYLPDPVSTAAVAQERVLRGEDLRGDPQAVTAGAELPLVLSAWEPAYALPSYRDRSAGFPEPAVATRPLPAPQRLHAGERLPDDAGVRALRDVVEPWVSQSSGRVEAVMVRGKAEQAIAQLADHASTAPLDGSEALAVLQWAGASGGAHGHRPGGAAGRFAAWWAAAALAGLAWPTPMSESFAEALGEAVGELAWYRWVPPDPAAGWTLRLAVTDPVDGFAWAVNATDQRDDDGRHD